MDYYTELSHMMDRSVEKEFIREDCLELYKVTADLDEMFGYIEGPHPERTVKDLKDG
jgi:hypothetical protein